MAMIKKAKKRMDQAGKKTRFERRGNDGQFHEVQTEKLDAFQKRLGTRATSALSSSSSKAQRIFYSEQELTWRRHPVKLTLQNPFEHGWQQFHRERFGWPGRL